MAPATGPRQAPSGLKLPVNGASIVGSMTGLTASFGLYDTSGAVAAAAADWWMDAARTAKGPTCGTHLGPSRFLGLPLSEDLAMAGVQLLHRSSSSSLSFVLYCPRSVCSPVTKWTLPTATLCLAFHLLFLLAPLLLLDGWAAYGALSRHSRLQPRNLAVPGTQDRWPWGSRSCPPCMNAGVTIEGRAAFPSA
jgi:hypothetical protein